MPPEPDRIFTGRLALNDDDGRFTALAFTLRLAPECLHIETTATDPIECREPALLDLITTLLSALTPG